MITQVWVTRNERAVSVYTKVHIKLQKTWGNQNNPEQTRKILEELPFRSENVLQSYSNKRQYGTDTEQICRPIDQRQIPK